jgi:IS1 family transposase/transposase-like protein
MDALNLTPAAPVCRTCGGPTIGWGKDSHGNPRRFCKTCKKSYGIIPPRPLGPMRLPLEKATLCVHLLTEGSSIRSTERVTGVHRDTICRLLRRVGEKCEGLLNRIVSRVAVQDVQGDEIWCFNRMKEKTKVRKGITDPEAGDCYTFVGMERTSKLVLAWHLGRRTMEDTNLFMAKLAGATTAKEGSDTYQLTTDGWGAYPGAVERHLGARVNFAQLVKTYSGEGLDSERRYSPPSIIASEKIAVSGNPDAKRVCTSHVERQNLHMRMQLRRFTRLTNAFSRKRANLEAALALHFAAFNLCWMHSSIRMTPAMKAGLVRKPWTVGDLLTA